MQLLHMASDDVHICARAVLDAVPTVFQFIRLTATRHRARGLSVQQFRALAYLHRRPGDSLSVLAEYLGLSLAASSRLIDSLVRKDLVKRAAVPSNRRKVHLTPTRRGQTLLGEVAQSTQQQLADKLKHLPPSRRRRVAAAVNDLQTIFEV
ncbi:MAG TPA: MarR family transcriptional regulator [Tepidisphaeraceae bacterium]|nr:MarR family transcriptional regulator [Tepidisphaeraceae bacterium]